MYAFIALALSVSSMLLGMEWATQLGLGLPLFVSGAVAFTYRAAIGDGDRKAMAAVAVAVLASSLWTTVAVATSGGSPSPVVWGARACLLAGLLYPLVGSRRDASTAGTPSA